MQNWSFFESFSDMAVLYNSRHVRALGDAGNGSNSTLLQLRHSAQCAFERLLDSCLCGALSQPAPFVVLKSRFCEATVNLFVDWHKPQDITTLSLLRTGAQRLPRNLGLATNFFALPCSFCQPTFLVRFSRRLFGSRNDRQISSPGSTSRSAHSIRSTAP